MELSKLLGGNYPYIHAHVPVYDATILAEGELLMRVGSWGNEGAGYYITAFTAANTEAEDTIGITMTSSTKAYASKENARFYNLASAVPSRTMATGNNFLPVIINPDALYMAFYDQADAVSNSTACSASTALTFTNLEDDIDGGWLYTTDGTDSAATYAGKLRYLTASALGSCTLDSAITVDTSSDMIKILPIGHRLVPLNAEATGLSCSDGTTPASGAADTIYLEIHDNYGRWASMPTHPLRYWNDKGLEGLGGKKAIFWGEIVQLKHAWKYVVV